MFKIFRTTLSGAEALEQGYITASIAPPYDPTDANSLTSCYTIKELFASSSAGTQSFGVREKSFQSNLRCLPFCYM